jgi:hypothetical protein
VPPPRERPVAARHVDAGIFEDERLFLGKLERARRRALRGVPAGIRDSAKVFVATDSAAMQALLLRLPGAVSRRTLFPPPGSGRHFCDYDELGATDGAGVIDTVADMFLLARCDALIRNPSQFSTYAVTMSQAQGRVQEIESFYAYRRRLRTVLARAGGSLGKRAVRRLAGSARPAALRSSGGER